jgi:hypothetical protein
MNTRSKGADLPRLLLFCSAWQRQRREEWEDLVAAPEDRLGCPLAAAEVEQAYVKR